jgi:hypothetical protein
MVGKDLDDLLAAWDQDLFSVVDEDKINSASEPVQLAFDRFKREGAKAFPLASTKKGFVFGSGFCTDRCLAHGSFAWMVRRSDKVHNVFKSLYGDVPLVTSLDVPFFTPEDTGSGPKPPYSSAHVDQNSHDSRGNLATMEEYQGVLYAWACRPEDESTATVVWPRSYQKDDETCPYSVFMQDPSAVQNGKLGMHYTQSSEMTGAKRQLLKKGFEQHARRVPVPAGGLLLWSSKSIHTGAQRGPRLAQAVCLEPKDRREEKERLAKMRLAALGLPTMHWASHAVQHDCIRLTKGYLTEGKTISGGESPSGVVFPMRNSVRPWCVTDEAFAKLYQAKEYLEFDDDVLEACIRDEAKPFL